MGLIFLPNLLWIFETWFGGVLGGAAAGLLTLPLCLILSYLASLRPAWKEQRPQRKGAELLLLLALGVQISSLLWARGRWDALMIGGIAAPFAVWAWIWGSWGMGMARALSMPIFFSLFALPWEHFLRRSLDLRLQIWSTDLAVFLLRLSGYAVEYWNEFTFYTEEYYVIVNETCSGMNMLITLSMYTLLFTWLAQPFIWDRLKIILLIFPIALLANALRIMAIYLMGYYGGNELAQGFWHTGSAYLIFLPVFWLIYAANEQLKSRRRRASAE